MLFSSFYDEILSELRAEAADARIGVLVSPVTFRHPAVLAKSLATLDVLSGGRVVAGLGLGWWADEHAAVGLPFPDVADRQRLLRSVIGALLLFLAELDAEIQLVVQCLQHVRARFQKVIAKR